MKLNAYCIGLFVMSCFGNLFNLVLDHPNPNNLLTVVNILFTRIIGAIASL